MCWMKTLNVGKMITPFLFFIFQYLNQRKKHEAEEKRMKQKKAREDFKKMLEVCLCASMFLYSCVMCGFLFTFLLLIY